MKHPWMLLAAIPLTILAALAPWLLVVHVYPHMLPVNPDSDTRMMTTVTCVLVWAVNMVGAVLSWFVALDGVPPK